MTPEEWHEKLKKLVVAENKWTAEEWAKYIGATIELAESNGYQVYISNECCGCSRMDLMVFKGGFDGDGSEAEVKW